MTVSGHPPLHFLRYGVYYVFIPIPAGGAILIYDGPLPEESRRKSQRNYYIFSTFNGFAYMCVGESVLILLTIKIGFPDFFVSIIGAMQYFGYLMLPLGRVVCARRGAAHTQSFFWVTRNLSAMLVAVAALMAACLGWWHAGIILFLGGAFLFYGLRAAGAVMSQPLVGSFTTEHDRGQVISLSNGIFYITCSLALLTISLLLSFSSSIWALTSVMIGGSCLGIFSSGFLRNIDESVVLRNSARKPLLPEMIAALESNTLRRQIATSFMSNLAIILLIPISMLALKRSYGVSDTQALLFALIQFGSAAMVSLGIARLAEIIGPRKMLLFSYCATLLVPLFWQFAGEEVNFALMAFVFALAGGGLISMFNANTHYFLQSTPEKGRVAGAILMQTVSAAGAGVAGMFLSGFLVRLCVSPEDPRPLAGFRCYFLLALLILLPGYWLIGRLKPLPKEKRNLGRLFWRLFTNTIS